MPAPDATINPADLRRRKLRTLDREALDIVIVGGGIYGAMLLLYAASYGLKAVLFERGDFGGETSFNSLRILHGGLRYLQSLDLARSRESIREQGWFMRQFPELVCKLPCLLPLYKQGLRRPIFMRIAFTLDRMLAYDRNTGLPLERHLPAARIISPSETVTRFPKVARDGLAGGALWHDAAIPDSQRLVIEALNWAQVQGGIALNYMDVTDVSVDDATVRGITVQDRESGERHEFTTRVVVNATGPWCESLAEKFDPAYERTTYPSVAWNVLFDRQALSECALGVALPDPGSQVYFLHPWKGRLLAGTGHGAMPDNTTHRVGSPHLDGMIADLNRAIPGLALTRDEIQRVMGGLLPVDKPASTHLSKRPIIHDHGARGGPQGLVSVAGVKLGASRVVAQGAMRAIVRRYFGRNINRAPALCDRPEPGHGWNRSALGPDAGIDDNWRAQLLELIKREKVVHLDDLVLRRTTLWENPTATMDIAPQLLALFDWDAQRFDDELSRLANALEAER